jgi:hypothetical protein
MLRDYEETGRYRRSMLRVTRSFGSLPAGTTRSVGRRCRASAPGALRGRRCLLDGQVVQSTPNPRQHLFVRFVCRAEPECMSTSVLSVRSHLGRRAPPPVGAVRLRLETTRSYYGDRSRSDDV